MKEEDYNSINVGGITWKVMPRPFSTGVDPYDSKFPRFDEYEPGTILEINFENNHNKENFLIIIVKHDNEYNSIYNNIKEPVIAINLSTGTFIIRNYVWKITYQEVKKGGLKNKQNDTNR